MAIKDRDGNVFKLRGPNPMMVTQHTWNNKNIIFHNMYFPIITMPDHHQSSIELEDYEPMPTPVESEIILGTEPGQTRSNLNVKIDQNQPNLNTSEHNPDKPGQIRTQQLAKLLEKRKITMLCLPVKIQNFEDNFYGSSYSRTQFGHKTTITGVIINSDDLQFVFWTDTKIGEKSIVYPTQTEMKRWWRVEKFEPQSGGFIASCSPSPISPDFSD